MGAKDPHANAFRRPTSTVVDRSRHLPADILHTREVEWMGELKSRLAAVEAWRGNPTHAHHVPPNATGADDGASRTSN